MASHCCTLHPRVQLSPSGECWFCRSYRPASGDRQPARLFYFLSLSLSLCLCVVSQVLQEALNAWVADNHPWRQPCIAQGAPFFLVRAISQLVFLRLSPKRTRAGAWTGRSGWRRRRLGVRPRSPPQVHICAGFNARKLELVLHNKHRVRSNSVCCTKNTNERCCNCSRVTLRVYACILFISRCVLKPISQGNCWLLILFHAWCCFQLPLMIYKKVFPI